MCMCVRTCDRNILLNSILFHEEMLKMVSRVRPAQFTEIRGQLPTSITFNHMANQMAI